MSEVIDLTKTCRICLSSVADLNDMKTLSVQNVLLLEVFKYIMGQECMADSFPKMICEPCTLETSSVYIFKKKCKKSFRHVTRYLNAKTIAVQDPFLFTYNATSTYTLEEETVVAQRILQKELDEGLCTETIKGEENLGLESGGQCLNVNDGFVGYQGFDNTVALSKYTKNECKDGRDCEDCGKPFTSYQRLQNHIRFHSGGIVNNHVPPKVKQTRVRRPKEIVKCETCNKTFLFESQLKRHMTMHTSERPYSCEQCGLTFAWSTSLQRHLTTHTGAKPHKCKICNKSFLLVYNLRQHEEAHLLGKQFSCDTCGAKFSWKSNLQRHEATHTGIKKHKCDLCDKGFIQLSHFRKHRISCMIDKLRGEEKEVGETDSYDDDDDDDEEPIKVEKRKRTKGTKLVT